MILVTQDLSRIRKKTGFGRSKLHDAFKHEGNVYWFCGHTNEGREYIVDNRPWVRLLWIALYPLRKATPYNECNLFVEWGIVKND